MLAISSVDRLLPAGTVAFLFTDIEGSTKLWEAHPEVMRATLTRHDALMREAIVRANGFVFKTMGDAFCAAFALAPDALSAALGAQRAITVELWPEGTPIKVRMALHTGAVEFRDGDYFGPALNRVARLLSTGHGGQTLLSQTTYDLVRDTLPDAVSLHDLGAHKLKDLARPEQVFELRHPDLPGDFPPIKSLSTHPNNLPQQLTSFIGREKAIPEIRSLLDKTRLLTLAGSGGSGKTRLSLQVAADTLEQFPDGIWFVELAALADAGLVSRTVASVLGVAEELDRSIVETLIEHLKAKRLLLLLDNCEHLLDACAKLADTVLRHCPAAKILATSREALGIAGEQTYRVPSLSLPDRSSVQTPQTLSMYESVRLFIDRALLVRQDFQVTNQNAPTLASLCHHLDGIPLAIELAAARVRSLSVEEIDGKLDQRFRLLTGGSRTALPRQQTLRSLIDWSYDLLREPERRLLRRLSVFAGGWTLAAAAGVCAGNGVADEQVLDLLTSLTDKSLVLAEQNEGNSRYRLLETVRQYARERLVESAGGETLRQRHLDYFLALAEGADPKLKGPEQAQWLWRLDEEHENLRAALEWSVVGVPASVGLRLCGALQRFWLMRGHLSEGREWCARILAQAGSEELTRERAKALNAAGVLAYHQSDLPAACARYEERLAIVRQLGDRTGIASALNNLGTVAQVQGNFARAWALHQESLAIVRELEDREGIAASLNNLGNVAADEGAFASAWTLHQESLSIRRELGDRLHVADSLRNLGSIAQAQGDYAAARSLFEEFLAVSRALGDRGSIAASLSDLGTIAYEQADYSAAEALQRESLVIRRELGDDREIAYSLEGLAEVIAALGEGLRAACIWGAAKHIREVLGSPLPPSERPRHDQCVAAARAMSGNAAAFDRAWQEGRGLTLERTVELALE